MHFPSSGIIYALTPSNPNDWNETLKKCKTILESGIKIVQFRDKNISDTEFLQRATELSHLVHQFGAIFIINDRVHLAPACGADGVHIGQEDMSIAEAQKILRTESIIGVSVHNATEAHNAEKYGATYVAANGFALSKTKPELTALGTEGLRHIREATSLPLIAIGGITPQNAAEACEAGADGVAVISTLFEAEDISTVCEALQSEVKRGSEQRREKETAFRLPKL